MRYAVKLGYDGSAFEGFQRQKGMSTVEGAIIDAARASGIFDNVKTARFASASRTDRGVSALGNAIAFDTEYKRGNIVPKLNSKVKDIWCWGIADVPEDFNPRHAVQRWYRYHLPPYLKKGLIEKGAELFVGTHDFLSYTRRADGDTVRTIDSVSVNTGDGFITIDLRAQRFLWNMVRRIVSALLRLERRTIDLEDIRASLKGGEKFNFGLAGAEELVLMDVSYGFEFEVRDVVLDKLGKVFEKSLFRVVMRKAFYEDLMNTISKRK